MGCRLLVQCAFWVSTLNTPYAIGAWEPVERTDRMTDEVTKGAVVKNQNHQQFLVTRSRTSSTGIEAHFFIADSDRDTLAPRGVIRARVDKNKPVILYDPTIEETFASVGIKSESRITPRAALNLDVSGTTRRGCLSSFLYQLAQGTDLVVEYRTQVGGVQYAAFRLGDGDRVISDAIGTSLKQSKQVEYCVARNNAVAACFEQYKQNETKKRSDCDQQMRKCADTADTAEKVGDCMA